MGSWCLASLDLFPNLVSHTAYCRYTVLFTQLQFNFYLPDSAVRMMEARMGQVGCVPTLTASR